MSIGVKCWTCSYSLLYQINLFSVPNEKVDLPFHSIWFFFIRRLLLTFSPLSSFSTHNLRPHILYYSRRPFPHNGAISLSGTIWRHDVKTLSALLWPINSLHRGPVTRSFIVCLLLIRTCCWTNNPVTGNCNLSWHHCNYHPPLSIRK